MSDGVILGACDKCRAPAVSFAVCKVATDPGATCDATYRRCEACGGEKGAERSVRAHQTLNHPAPYLQPWRRSKRTGGTTKPECAFGGNCAIYCPACDRTHKCGVCQEVAAPKPE